MDDDTIIIVPSLVANTKSSAGYGSHWSAVTSVDHPYKPAVGREVVKHLLVSPKGPTILAARSPSPEVVEVG